MEEKGMGKQRWEKMLLQAAFDGNLRLLRKMARGLVTTGRGRGEADVLAAVAGGGRGGPREPRAAPGGHRGEDGRPHDHLFMRLPGKPDKVFNLDDTPLNMAISSKSLECVKLLIQAGADVNFRDSNGATYVMMAANYGFSGIMKCLLDAGANPNIPDQFGVFPIEVAALQVHREIVEMLFPLTSPISTVPDWSIDGIFAHAKNFGSKPLPEDLCVKKIAQMKVEGKEAFKRKDYLLAAQLYTSALGLGPSPDDSATLLANRSLCWLRLENGKQALADANMCRMFRPHWIKACYRQGAAFMLLKEYGNACDAFSDGLKLDPANVDIENALRAALQAVKNDRCVKNNQ
uniref:Serine/threonine-protein kinase BSK1-like TPR repeats domain-containing protein n=1 Tax=Oryza rufipogon TaxID=4529 RepID=A0A0E0QN18_ORYRU